MGQPISTLKLPWVTSSPFVLPDQLGDGIDRDRLEEGLQRLIACEGWGLFCCLAQERWAPHGPIPTSIWL